MEAEISENQSGGEEKIAQDADGTKLNKDNSNSDIRDVNRRSSPVNELSEFKGTNIT
jgi:hypothetical protein